MVQPWALRILDYFESSAPRVFDERELEQSLLHRRVFGRSRRVLERFGPETLEPFENV
jgi:hypothetical protein